MIGALSAGLRGGHRLARIRPPARDDTARSSTHLQRIRDHRSDVVCFAGDGHEPQPSEQPTLGDAGSAAAASTPTTTTTTTTTASATATTADTAAAGLNYDPDYIKCKTRRERKYEEEYEKLPPEERDRRLKIRQSNTGNTPWNKGRKHSPETIEKIRQRTKEALMRPEVAAKVAKVNKERIGTKTPDEIKEKIAKKTRASKEAATPEQKEELRRKCSETTKALWQDPVYREKVMASLRERNAARTAASQARKAAQAAARAAETPEQREERLERRRAQEAARRAALKGARTPEEVEEMRLKALEKARERGKAVWADPVTAAERRAKISAAIRAKWADPEYRERTMAGISRAHDQTNYAAGWTHEELSVLQQVVEEYPLVTFTWQQRHEVFMEHFPDSGRTQGGLARKYHAQVAAGKLPPIQPGPPTTNPSRATSPRRTASPTRRASGAGSGSKAAARAKDQAAIEASKAALQKTVQRVQELQRMVVVLEDKLSQLRSHADDLANDPAAYSDCVNAMRESEALLGQARQALDRQLALIPPYIHYNSKGIITDVSLPPSAAHQQQPQQAAPQQPAPQQQLPQQPQQSAPQQPQQQQQQQQPWSNTTPTSSAPTPDQPQAPTGPSPYSAMPAAQPPPPTPPGSPSSNGVHPPQPTHYYSPPPYWHNGQHPPPYPPQQHPYPPPTQYNTNGTYPPAASPYPSDPSSPYPPSTPDQHPSHDTPPSMPPQDQPWGPQATPLPYVQVNGWGGHPQANGYSNGVHHPHQPHLSMGGAPVNWGGGDMATMAGAGWGGSGQHQHQQGAPDMGAWQQPEPQQQQQHPQQPPPDEGTQ